MTSDQRRKLSAILDRTMSGNANEATAAMIAANRYRASLGLSWQNVLDGTAPLGFGGKNRPEEAAELARQRAMYDPGAERGALKRTREGA